ncbi:hypothetical protein C7212DRAFT_321618, partial [Tuber magnatum]
MQGRQQLEMEGRKGVGKWVMVCKRERRAAKEFKLNWEMSATERSTFTRETTPSF